MITIKETEHFRFIENSNDFDSYLDINFLKFIIIEPRVSYNYDKEVYLQAYYKNNKILFNNEWLIEFCKELDININDIIFESQNNEYIEFMLNDRIYDDVINTLSK
jgi:hypothetical protein